MFARQPQPLRQLEAFIVNNPLLEQLEALVAEFNIFEAMGAVRQELRHSDFLAFLLNPAEKHSLGDLFLKRFLIQVLSTADRAPLSPITIDTMNLNDVIVERETDQIDILIHDTRQKLVCLIENEIDTAETSDHLTRYLRSVRDRFSDRDTRFIPIYLSPEGDEAANNAYLPISYTSIADLIERIQQSQSTVMGGDANTMLRHYVIMLRRHIVSDSNIADLCRQIYRQHKGAIDLIIEHIPDLRQGIADYLMELIDNTAGTVRDQSVKTYIRFIPHSWDNIAALKRGEGWTSSGRILLFELHNAPDSLSVGLVVGPGPVAIRETLFDYAQRNSRDFQGMSRNLSQNWSTIFRRKLLLQHDYGESTLEDLIPKIEAKWQQFLERDLPVLHDHIMRIRFPVGA